MRSSSCIRHLDIHIPQLSFTLPGFTSSACRPEDEERLSKNRLRGCCSTATVRWQDHSANLEVAGREVRSKKHRSEKLLSKQATISFSSRHKDIQHAVDLASRCREVVKHVSVRSCATALPSKTQRTAAATPHHYHSAKHRPRRCGSCHLVALAPLFQYRTLHV